MNPVPRFNQVLVLSTAMLTFISFWKAASIVLCDFGSSAYYAGGIAMKAFGPAFPWFILAVMLFAGVMLMVYIESCAMFVRGGVYVAVREAMGKVMAKGAVSALVFDYVITGPISSITAGLYISYLLANLLPLVDIGWKVPPDTFAMVFGAVVTAYFWRENIKGVEESGEDNVRIVSFVALVAAVLLAWSAYAVWERGFRLPPFELQFTPEALGWARDMAWLHPVGVIGLFMAFGHSILALSGLETLAQVYREIEDPKIPNLKKTVLTVFSFSVLFTGVLTFLASMIIPGDLIATKYADNLLSGLALELPGPYWARLALQSVVVVSGGLILSGAVNTSLVGANGMLNRVAEDGILHDWFRHLHKKYGTTYRIINLVAITQIAIILISRGNIFLLGEAYAFGVIWSLIFNTLALIVLRFKDTETEREWMFPLNIKIDKVHVPVGLMLVFLALFVTGCTNLLTKRIATVSGLAFSAVFFVIFQISEKLNEKKARLLQPEEETEEKLNMRREADIATVIPELDKPRRVLVPVRNPNNLVHLRTVLEGTSDDDTDIVVLLAKIVKGLEFGRDQNVVMDEDKDLFRSVVLLAEKYGKTVKPMMVFSNDPFYSIAQVAHAAGASEIVMGVSGSTGAEVQLERLAMAWGMLEKPGSRQEVTAKIIWEGRTLTYTLT